MPRTSVNVGDNEFVRGVAAGDQIAVSDDTFAQLVVIEELFEKLIRRLTK